MISIRLMLLCVANPWTSLWTVYPTSLSASAIREQIVWWRVLRRVSPWGQRPRTWASVSISLRQRLQRLLSWLLPGQIEQYDGVYCVESHHGDSSQGREQVFRSRWGNAYSGCCPDFYPDRSNRSHTTNHFNHIFKELHWLNYLSF